jgi:hypothetical protein
VRQVEPVSAICETRDDVIRRSVADLASRSPGPFVGSSAIRHIEAVQASEPGRLISDPAGFFVVYPDSVRQRLVIAHSSNAGVLDAIVEGASPAAVYTEIIERKLSRGWSTRHTSVESSSAPTTVCGRAPTTSMTGPGGSRSCLLSMWLLCGRVPRRGSRRYDVPRAPVDVQPREYLDFTQELPRKLLPTRAKKGQSHRPRRAYSRLECARPG